MSYCFVFTDMPTKRFALALLASAASTLSCSVLIDTKDSQCNGDADCASLGEVFAGSVCQANVCVARGCPAAPASPDATVKLSFHVSFAAPPDDPQPFQVRACQRLDSECAAPVGGPTQAKDGELVELEVPTGFLGFVQVTNPDAVPTNMYLGQPVQQDMRGWDLQIPTPETVALLGSETDTKLNANLGTLVMIARDCNRNPLAGVQATNSSVGTGFYFADMVPDKTLSETTAEGAAGFVNVPLGDATLSGIYEERDMSPNVVVSKKGWFSYAEVFP
jgi:hypothetical protein